jgi:hypothetical protein
MVHSDSEWDVLIRDYRRGSRTQVDFCASRGINVWSFRNRLYRRRGVVACGATDEDAKLVRVELPMAMGAVEIAVADVVLRVVAGTDTEYVASLVRALRQGAC